MPKSTSLNKQVDAANKQIAALEKQISKLKNNIPSALEKAGVSMADYGKAVDSVTNKLKTLNATSEKLNSSGLTPDMRKAVSDYDTQIKELTAHLEELTKKHKAAAEKGLKDDWVAITKEIEKTDEKIKNLSESMTFIGKDSKETFSNVYDAIKGGREQIGGLWKAVKSGSFKNIKDQAKVAGEMANKLKSGGTVLSKMPGAMGMAGKAATLLGGALGKAGLAFAGPVGAIAAAVVEVGKLALATDRYVKDMNRQFQSVRGPAMAGGAAYKDFTGVLYNFSTAMKTGFNKQQIMELFTSMSQAGTAVGQLGTSTADYARYVVVASNASKNMGLELTRVAQVEGQMTTDFRMDINQINEAFVQAAFDASRAGVNSERFLQSVMNASASLAMYGVNIKMVSAEMAELVKRRSGTVEQAEKLGESLEAAISTEDIGDQLKNLELAVAGGLNLDKFAQETLDKMKRRREELPEELKAAKAEFKAKPTEEARAKVVALEKEQAAVSPVAQKRLEDAIKQGLTIPVKDLTGKITGYKPTTAAANILPILAGGRALEFVQSMMKGVLQKPKADLSNLSTNDQLILKQTAGLYKISQTQVQQVLDASTKTAIDLKDVGATLAESSDYFSDSADKLVQEGKIKPEQRASFIDKKKIFTRDALIAYHQASKMAPGLDRDKALQEGLTKVTLALGIYGGQVDKQGGQFKVSEDFKTILKDEKMFSQMLALVDKGTAGLDGFNSALDKSVNSTDYLSDAIRKNVINQQKLTAAEANAGKVMTATTGMAHGVGASWEQVRGASANFFSDVFQAFTPGMRPGVEKSGKTESHDDVNTSGIPRTVTRKSRHILHGGETILPSTWNSPSTYPWKMASMLKNAGSQFSQAASPVYNVNVSTSFKDVGQVIGNAVASLGRSTKVTNYGNWNQ